MIHRLLYIISIIALTVLTACTKNTSVHYVIIGQFADIDTGLVYLSHYGAHKFNVVDSATVHHNGSFKFEGNVPGPELYGISVIKDTRHPATFFVENDTMCVKVWESCNDITVQHSALNDLYLKNKQLVFENSFNADSFVTANPDSPVTAYFLSRELSWDRDCDQLQELRSKLSSDLDECVYVKQLDQLIINMQNLRPGSAAKDFSMCSIDGRDIKLSSFRGKKVLLTFWASWCPDCKQELPALLKLYKQTDRSEVQFIGISVNSNKDELKKAVIDYKIEWPQICDGKEWLSPIVMQYAIRGVPTFILIDENGKIMISGGSVERMADQIRGLSK